MDGWRDGLVGDCMGRRTPKAFTILMPLSHLLDGSFGEFRRPTTGGAICGAIITTCLDSSGSFSNTFASPKPLDRVACQLCGKNTEAMLRYMVGFLWGHEEQ